MIQQRTVVMQQYVCPQTRKVKHRPVRQFAKVHFDGKTLAFKAPRKRSMWGQLVQEVFGRAA